MPFDVSGLFLYGLLFLVLYAVGFWGLVGLAGILWLKKGKKLFAFIVFVCAFIFAVAPPWIISSRIESVKIGNEERRKDVAQKKASNIAAFSEYCKDRKPIIYNKPDTKKNAALFVRVKPTFHGLGSDLNASSLSKYMQTKGRFSWKQPEICSNSPLRFFEGQFDGKYDPQRKGYVPEIRNYWICENRKPENQEDISAEYELVLGDSFEKVQAPFYSDQAWFARYSAKIMDRLNGNLYAEDTLYFFEYHTGQGSCPEGLSQLSDLITEVFSSVR